LKSKHRSFLTHVFSNNYLLDFNILYYDINIIKKNKFDGGGGGARCHRPPPQSARDTWAILFSRLPPGLWIDVYKWLINKYTHDIAWYYDKRVVYVIESKISNSFDLCKDFFFLFVSIIYIVERWIKLLLLRFPISYNSHKPFPSLNKWFRPRTVLIPPYKFGYWLGTIKGLKYLKIRLINEFIKYNDSQKKKNNTKKSG